MDKIDNPAMDARVKRLNEAYEYLRSEGRIHTKKELAAKIGISYANVSSAMKGDARYLTNNFLVKFNNAFGCIFSFDWLNVGWGHMIEQKESGKNDLENNVTMPREVFDQITRLTETVLSQQRTIEKLADLQKGVAEGVKGAAPKAALG